MAKLTGNKNNQMVALDGVTSSANPISTPVSQYKNEYLGIGQTPAAPASNPVQDAMAEQAARLAERAEYLNAMQEALNERYAALQAGTSTETADQIAREQDVLNMRKENLAVEQYEYNQRAAEYGEILSAIPYQDIEEAAKESGTRLTGGTKAILDTMRQRLEQNREKQKQLNAKREELAMRVEDFRNGVGNDTQETLNREVAALTMMEQNLVGKRTGDNQSAAGLAGATAQGAADQIMEQAYANYYNQEAMGQKYETEKAALYAEWQDLNKRELETGIYRNRTASDVWDDIQKLEDEYQGYLIEADNYWARKKLEQLNTEERELVEEYVKVSRNIGAKASGEYASQEKLTKLRDQLIRTYGSDRANELIQLGERIYDAEVQTEQNKALKEYAKQGVVQVVVASAASVVTNALAAPGALVEIVRQKINNPAGIKTLNVYAPGFQMQNATRSFRGGVQESIMPDADNATFAQRAVVMVYGAVMSGIDSFVGSRLPGKAGSALLGATTYTNTAQDITERGGTMNQAMLGGLAAGAFEMIFEDVSIGKLKALEEKDTVRTIKDYLINVAKSVGTNASEEAATEMANILFDIVAMGNVSNYEMQLQELMADNPNMSEAEAKRQLAGAMAMQVVESAVSGALMGGMFGVLGSTTAMRNTKKTDTFYNTFLLPGLIDQGLTYQGTTAFDMAADMQVRINEGKMIPHEEVTALAEQVQKQVDAKRQQGAGIAESTNAYTVEEIMEVPETVEEIAAAIPQQVETGETAVQQDEVSEEAPAQVQKEVTSEEATAQEAQAQEAPSQVQQEVTGEEAPTQEAVAPAVQETVRAEAPEGNTSALPVVENTAQVNTEENALRREAEAEIRGLAQMYQGEELRQAAQNLANDMRMAGETAYAEEIEAAAAEMLPKMAVGAVSANNITAPAVGTAVQTEDVTYGREEGGVRLRTGGERNDGQSAGRQTTGVAEKAGRTPAADERRQLSAKQSKSKRIAERVARGDGKSTRAATGLTNASGNSRYQVYELEERDMDAEAYEIINDAMANGYEVHLYYKGLYFNVKGGRTIRVDGSRAGDRLYIRMDAEHFTGRQIANHEMFHAMAEDNPGLVDAIMGEIMSEYTEEELEELLAYYAELYAGAYDEAELNRKIVEELCADVYAGMDRANVEVGKESYARVSQKTEAVRGMTERRTGLRAIGERGVQETRAGPVETKNAPADAEATGFSFAGNRTVGNLYDYSKSFEEQIEDYKKGNIPSRDTLLVCGTPEVLQDIGLLPLPMTINQTHIDYAIYGTKDFNHFLTEEGLKQIPEAIKQPVAVMVSKTRPNSSIVVMIEVRQNGKQVVLPVAVDGFGYQNGIRIDSNAITSAYGRDFSISRVLKNAIQDEANGKFSLYYLNKEKSTKLLQGARVIMPKVLASLPDGSIHRVTDAGSPVKTKFADVTQTQQFRRWFGKSKVIGKDGKPLVMYHGTREENGNFTVFDQDKAVKRGGLGLKAMGKGNYFTSTPLNGTERYGSRVIQAYISIKHPFIYQVGSSFVEQVGRTLGINTSSLNYDDLQSAMRHAGYDGVIQYDKSGNVSIAVTFDSNQIKSATDNIGTFDPDNPDINFSLASGQSFEQVETRILELEGLMENLMVEQKMMDPADFNVQWFNLQMEKAALESELFDQRQAEEKQRLREEAKARREKAEQEYEKIEKHRSDARRYKKLADQAEQEYEKTEDAKFLESAKKYRDLEKEFRRKAADLQKEVRGTIQVKDDRRVYKPTEAIKRTQNRLLDLFKIQAGGRGEARQALTNVMLDTLERGYVGQDALENVLRQMYRTGVDVVPGEEIYQDIAATLKGQKIYVSNALKAEYGDDWGTVRKQLLGLGIYTTNERGDMGVDSVYAELAVQYPGVFDENNVDMRGMLDEMMEAASMGRPSHMSLADSAAVRGLDSEEDFWNLYRLASEELARFADAAGIESRVLSKKEWQIAQEQAEHSAKEKKILKASRERAEEIRRQELGKRQAMIAKRQRVEQMDKLRRQIERLNRKVERNDALLNVALKNLDQSTVEIARQAMGTVDLISNGFRKSTQKDLLALKEGVDFAKRENPNFEEDALEIIKNALLQKKEYQNMEAGKFDQKAKARLDQALAAMDRLGKRQLTDMNVDDLTAMYDAINAIIHEIDTADELLGEAWDMSVDEGAINIREELSRAKGLSERAMENKGKARHLMVEQSLSPSRMLARLVGYDRSGAMGKVIREFEQGDLAAMKYSLDADLIFSSFLKDKKNQEWIKTATGKEAKMTTLEIPLVLEYGEGDAPIYDPNAKTEVQVSQMMLVQMALDLENEANIRHAEKGGYTIPNAKAYRNGNHDAMYTNAKTVKIPKEALQKIVQENLSEEGKLFAKLLHRYYNGVSKVAINETSQKLHGVDVARVKNYYPIHTDQAYRGQEYNVFDATLESMGSLKERQYSESPILLEDAADTFRWHRDSMARYVGYAVARRNFVALLNHRSAGGKTLRSDIEDKWSASAGKSIDEFFKILETGQLEEVSDVLSGLQSKYAGAVLSFNVGSMMKQLGALPLAGSTVGHGAILHGMLYPTKMGKQQREFIRKYTPYLDYRGKGYTYREVAEAAGQGIQDERVYKTLDYLMGRNWLEAMDIKINTALWHAAEYAVRRDTKLKPGKQEDIEAGIDPYHKAVAEVFNRMTHDTQTNYNLMARPPVLMRKGPVLRAFTMFRTDAYQVTGVLRENIGAHEQAKRNLKNAKTDEEKAKYEQMVKQTGTGVARSVAAVIGNGMISVIVDELRQMIRGNDDEYFDEEGNFRWGNAAAHLGKELLMNIAGAFMFVEELAEYIEAKITGERYYEPETSRIGMLVDSAESLWKLGETVWKMVRQASAIRKDGGDVSGYLSHEWDDLFGTIKDTVQKASYLTGVPVKNMERTITTALGWILPEAAVAYDDMFTDYSKALLRDMSKRELPYGIDAYLRDNCSITDDAVRDEYLRLYETVGDSMMPGANPPDKIVNGEGEERVERELTLTDTGRWDSKYREIMIDETKRMIESEAYQNLTDKEKAAALAKLDEYAEKVADEYIGHDVDAWVERSINVGADAVNISIYKAATKDMKSGEAYQWIVESGMTQAEAIEVLGVEMQDKDGHTNGYHEMVKAMNEHGIELSEWADLYELGSSRVEAFNKWCEDGLKPETAITLAETVDALEPEPGKEQVSDMQKYRAIDASGLSDEEKLNAMSVLIGMEMETESGEPSQRAKMLRVVESGASLTEYLDMKEAEEIDQYIKMADAGIGKESARTIASAVVKLEPMEGNESVTDIQKYRAIVATGISQSEQIKAFGAYMKTEMKTESGEPSTYAKMLRVVESGASLTEYLDMKEAEEIDQYIRMADAGLGKDSARKVASAVVKLEPMEGYESVTAMQKYRTIVATGISQDEQIKAIGAYMKTEMETESGDPSTYAKMLKVIEGGASVPDYLDIKEAGGVDNYLEAVDLGLNREKAKEVVEAVAALPKLPKGEEYTSDQKKLAALSACDTAEEQIIVYATYGSSDDVITTTAKFTAAAKYDVTPEMYLKAKALAKADFNKDNNDSLNSKEVAAALRSMDLTNRQRAALWQMFGISWKKNPFGNTADIRTAYEKAKEEKKKQKD